MADSALRLMRLLSLLQARPDWTGSELAARMQVTPRTVRRDIDRLRAIGYTVDARPGAAGGYRLGFGTGIPPLLLDAEEAIAVAVALRSATSAGLVGGGEAALQALMKLERALPSAMRRRVDVLHTTLVELSGPAPEVRTDLLMALAAAALDSRRVRIDYRSHKGSQIRRRVEPHRVVHVGALWYLVAWDLDRDGWRTYRLDRIASHARLDGSFEPRPFAEEKVAALVSTGITTSPYPVRCRLTVLAPAELVGESVGPAQGVVRRLTDQTCEVTGGSVSLHEMALWVARLGFEIVIHEPAELREAIGEMADRLHRTASAQD